jgi:hypothetical protein
LGLLAGSNAIQILKLRKETLNYTRKTEAKLSLLREVIQRVKNGEDVDVRKALGTGEEEAEREWEEVIKELEDTDGVAEGWRKRAEKRRLKDEQKARDREGGSAATPKDDRKADSSAGESPESQAETRPKFMM